MTVSSPPRALVSGASIAGLSAAFWLRRAGWEVTVLERAATFRDGGQNVDVRGVAHEVLDRMGLTDAVADQHTTETGTVFVDADGGVVAELPSDGPDGATAELEILRGDFARTVLDHLPPGVEIRYGDAIEDVEDDGEVVRVTTASGATDEAELLVVAEGVRSATRDRLFGDAVGRRGLGIAMVFGTVPRTAADDTRWRWYTATGGRTVHLRPDGHGTTRAMLAFTSDDEGLVGLDRDELVARLRREYEGVGWEAPRVLDGLASSDDVYVDLLTQIRMPSWHRGRVCLVGDAAWCVTPLGGGGASLALTSGYVLAASLSTSPDGAVGPALEAYERWLRPLVDDVADVPDVRRFAYPQTRAGVALHDAAAKVLLSPPLRGLAARFTRVAATDRSLPVLAGDRAG